MHKRHPSRGFTRSALLGWDRGRLARGATRRELPVMTLTTTSKTKLEGTTRWRTSARDGSNALGNLLRQDSQGSSRQRSREQARKPRQKSLGGISGINGISGIHGIGRANKPRNATRDVRPSPGWYRSRGDGSRCVPGRAAPATPCRNRFRHPAMTKQQGTLGLAREKTAEGWAGDGRGISPGTMSPISPLPDPPSVALTGRANPRGPMHSTTEGTSGRRRQSRPTKGKGEESGAGKRRPRKKGQHRTAPGGGAGRSRGGAGRMRSKAGGPDDHVGTVRARGRFPRRLHCHPGSGSGA